MPIQSRATIKKYFEKGDYPTAGQFNDLIDSVPNIKDEGIPTIIYPKGDWAAGVNYVYGDAVYLDGSTYYCLVDHTSEQAKIPPAYPLDQNTWWKVWSKKGNTGDKGEKGEKGDQGLKGDKGDTGEKGDTGVTGPQGIQGLKGDKGDKGDTGETGSQGPQGLKGDKGDTGETGAQGIQGIQGPKGDTGDVGPQGPKGDKGDPGTGDVNGAASSVDNTIPRYDGTTGKLIQGSSVVIDDNNDLGIGVSIPNAKLDIQDPSSIGLNIKRTGKFDFVQSYLTATPSAPSVTGWNDWTNEAAITRGTITGDVLNQIDDYFVFGKTDTFSSIYIDIGTAKSTGGTFVWEYSLGGGNWGTLTVTDGTSSLTTDGSVTFTPPNDWATDTLNSSAQLYFVRIRVTAGSFTTEPTIYLAVPNISASLLEVYGNANDSTPSLQVDANGCLNLRNINTLSALGSITHSGSLSGTTSIANSSTITNTLSTTGTTYVGGLILNGPAATSGTTVQNSPIVRFSSQAWNTTPTAATKINAMDIAVVPTSGATTSAKMVIKNTTVDGAANANELVSVTTAGNMTVSGTVTASNIASGATVSGSNTGDETATTIKTKLGISTLSGSNTGDQDLSGLVPKTTQVNGHALSGNVTVTAADVGLGTMGQRAFTASTSDPSGGSDGDIWFKYV